MSVIPSRRNNSSTITGYIRARSTLPKFCGFNLEPQQHFKISMFLISNGSDNIIKSVFGIYLTATR